MSLLGIACGGRHAAATLLVLPHSLPNATEAVRIMAVTEQSLSGGRSLLPERAIAHCLDWAEPVEEIQRVALVRPETARSLPQARRIEAELSTLASIRRALATQWELEVPIQIVDCGEAIAAGAYFASPFPRAAILRLDEAATWAGVGVAGQVRPLRQSLFPDTLGAFWRAMTEYLGFLEDTDAVEALAAWAEPTFLTAMRRVLSPQHDGWPTTDLSWAAWHRSAGGSLSEKFARRFGPARAPWDPVEERHAHVAASAQALIEECVLALAAGLRKSSGMDSLCLCGMLAQNTTLAGRLLRDGPFDALYLPPASGEEGAALGAALAVACSGPDRPRIQLRSARIGPEYDNAYLKQCLDSAKLRYTAPRDLPACMAALLAEGKLVGCFEGRAPFGGLSFGGRCVLADPSIPESQELVQAAVLDSEMFRVPGACIAEEDAARFFTACNCSRFSQFRFHVSPEWEGLLPIVTPDDGLVRVHTVSPDAEPMLHAVLRAFESRRGIPMLAIAPLNARGGSTPEAALQHYFCTRIDAFVLGRWLLHK